MSFLYVMILAHPFHGTSMAQSHQQQYVSIVASPVAATACHNLRQATATDLQEAAPYCYPTRLTGPFTTVERAKVFAHSLIQGTRGATSLHKRLDVLRQQTEWADLDFYADNVPLPVPLSTFFERHGAPPNFVEAAARLEEAEAILCFGGGGAAANN